MNSRQPPTRSHLMASRITPLGIIAGFVALSEAAGATAATLTDGGIQVAFTYFAIGFPVLAGAAFFVTLWNRNYVLYPPKDFGPDVDVQRYVQAMRHQVLGNREVLSIVQESINAALNTTQAQASLTRLAATQGGEDSPWALQQASLEIAEQALVRIRDSVVLVEMGDFSERAGASQLVFPFDPSEDAFDFLTAVYTHISVAVPPFTYGQLWALEEAESGVLLLPDGTDWRDNFRFSEMGATVSDLGLEAGMTVRVVALRR